MRLCEVEGCGRKHNAKGLCNMHGDRLRRGLDLHHERATPARDYMNEWLEVDSDECFEWPFFRNPDGYAILRWEGKNKAVHRFACEKANGPSPFEGAVVRHTCGNGMLGCFNPKHVIWGTVAENNTDRVIQEKQTHGEESHFAKITAELAVQIYNDPRTPTEIGKALDINRHTVYKIKNGKTWARYTGHKKKGGG